MTDPGKGARALRDTDWVSAHLFYQGDLDNIIVNMVGPAVSALRNQDAETQWFFLRHWNGGPQSAAP